MSSQTKGQFKKQSTTNQALKDYYSDEVMMVKKRLRYHHKLIILHEIVSDIKMFSNMKDADEAKVYQEKLILID